ncbi:hypothetical protein FTW19_19975 [Terriglobus albidus]|uniref:ATP-grasp domain-containing protein n=1 Tax=Terriglobus albidus TaxID=1592106 RepID=A0A5B9ECW7_9BACT|nr:hypothetical protein [Terriglobus albidus]QEE30058.1 hypothetical protein FTW19_19975 [Terriglobus albidus]
MAIIIISDLVDYHAAAVAWALAATGVPYVQWEGIGYEEPRQASIELGSYTRVRLGGHLVSKNDVIWFRRPRQLSYHPDMAVLDRRFAMLESLRFSECLGAALDEIGCRCVNSPTAVYDINRKAAQIILAHKVGLLVPHTLMGNQPPEIEDFFRSVENDAVYKAFLPHLWFDPDTESQAILETKNISSLANDVIEVATYTPGIYQKRVRKVADIRVLVMGELMRAFVLHSEALDWRYTQDYADLKIKERAIPAPIRSLIEQFMSAAGIVTGSLDFGLDEHGQWWFFEINESGQFLWIDHSMEGAGVFQDFLAFLSGKPRELFPCLKDYRHDDSILDSRPKEMAPIVTVEHLGVC